MDAVLGSQAAEASLREQRPGTGATQLPTGFMSNVAAGSLSDGGAADPSLALAAPASQRPPPALKLKDRLRAIGINASSG